MITSSEVPASDAAICSKITQGNRQRKEIRNAHTPPLILPICPILFATPCKYSVFNRYYDSVGKIGKISTDLLLEPEMSSHFSKKHHFGNFEKNFFRKNPRVVHCG